MDLSRFYGRLITWPKTKAVPAPCQILPTFVRGRCQRCGQKDRARLGTNDWYCLQCLKMGRVSTRDLLLTIPEPNQFLGQSYLTWPGELTSAQNQVSQDLLASYDRRASRLIWAVTGAGKTEMLFFLIDHVLQERGRVGFLSPRVDVVLELAPRLQAAFSCSLQILHGQAKTPYQYRQLVLATTHQALLFYRAFDLLIIDEVDAFPFHNDAALAYAVQQSRKASSTVVYLTATPTPALKKLVKQKKIDQSYLPQRFHQGLLPQIQVKRVGNWRKRAPHRLQLTIDFWITQGNPFLIFVPRVEDLVIVYQYLQPNSKISGATVHANDPDRSEKVKKLRAGEYRYLVTTTILERGVTLPGLEVLILGADDLIFSTAALVQIAGRVGRSRDQPQGLVLALVQEPTLCLRSAQKQINELNQRAQALVKEF